MIASRAEAATIARGPHRKLLKHVLLGAIASRIETAAIARGSTLETLMDHALAGLIAGHRDHDLLLDPCFHYSTCTAKQGFRHPDLGIHRDAADLNDAYIAVGGDPGGTNSA
jgi:hypothetical protein